MYKEYFGLREAPFSITPDPRYVYMSLRHQEALAHLLYGTGEEGGFVQLTGEVGTGKTTLIRVLLEQELGETDVALIIHPRLTLLEFVATICDELGAGYPTDATTLKPLIDALNRHLLRSHAKGRQTVVIVDEAQNLVPEVLEQVRLLTNLETSKHKLLRIILVGQPELKEVLDRHDMRQLAQRITARCHLDPLSRAEVAAYVAHRLEVAGGRRDIFSPAALRKVHKVTGGIPRLINVVCDRALLGAYTESARQVEAKTVTRAAIEAFGKPRGVIGTLSPRRLAVAVVIALLVATGAAIPILNPKWLPWHAVDGGTPGPLARDVSTPPQIGNADDRQAQSVARTNSAEATADDKSASEIPVVADADDSIALPGSRADTVALAMARARMDARSLDEPEFDAGATSPTDAMPRRAASAALPQAEPGTVYGNPEPRNEPNVDVRRARTTDVPAVAEAPLPTPPIETAGTKRDDVVDLRQTVPASNTQVAKLIDLGEQSDSTAGDETEVIDLRGLSSSSTSQDAEVIDVRGVSAKRPAQPSLGGDNLEDTAARNPTLSFQELARAVSSVRAPERIMFDRLFGLWGLSVPGTSGGSPCIEAYGLGMRCLEGQAAWHKLRRWDRPALIWLQAGDDSERPVLLRSLGSDDAEIDLGKGPRTVRIGDLEAFWTGRFIMVWKLQSRVALIGLGSTDEPVQWLHERLNLADGLPMDSGEPPSTFDTAMRERVVGYQRRLGLSADGIVGQYTMIELNNLAPAPGTPRLVR